jgi:hypothetical protein
MTTDAIADLTERVKRLEQQVSDLQSARKENHLDPDDLFADNEMIARTFEEILRAQDIDLAPISAKELQKLFAQLDLEPSEFSRGIMEMREE